MSRYGRISDADDLDRYYSPKWPLELFLEEGSALWNGRIAEPCAGRGDMVEVLEDHGCDVVAGDIDPGSPYPAVDATDPEAVQERYSGCDAVITNPPYSAMTGSAFDVLEALVTLETPIAMLVRLSFLEPPAKGDRKACYMEGAGELRPVRVKILPRVQYSGPKGGDDNPATSCWCVWRPGLDVNGDEPGLTTSVEWWTAEDRDRVKGQPALV